MKHYLHLIVLFFLISNTTQAQFIHREGKTLQLNDEEIHLRGMSFGNLVWTDREIPSAHHNEKDYQRLADLGMNAIRFYLNYKTFEDDSSPYTYKQTGWDWIDQNIVWAKKHGIYLILNMHVPQGGFQSQCEGTALWDTPANQDRLVELWKAIAEQYKDEPQIAAYDILNEPIPKDSVEQWFQLCNNIVEGIRTVDQNHLLITERAIAVNCDYGYNDGNYNYPPIDEENLMYTVHMYEPYAFSHQNLDWANTGDGGSYPDPNLLSEPSDITYVTGQFNNPKLTSGTTDWKFYQGQPFLVNNDSLIIGRTVLNGHSLGEGIAYYDDFTVNEVNAQGSILREIFKIPLTENETIWDWSQNNDGQRASSTEGHNDNFCITKTGTSGYGSTTLAEYSFKVEKGKYYSTSGWMKGDNIPTASATTASISNEFYYSPTGKAVGTRDYNYLQQTIVNYTKYIEDKGFPVYFGEFGVARNAFENNKGGERWVRDVLSIFDSLGYNFTYHAYRESSFGYYETWDGPLDTTTINVLLQNEFLNFFEKDEVGLIPSSNLGSNYNIYPIPFHTQLQINDKEISSYRLINALGETILEGSNKKIETEDLSKGTYLLLLYDTNGSILGSKKLVK